MAEAPQDNQALRIEAQLKLDSGLPDSPRSADPREVATTPPGPLATTPYLGGPDLTPGAVAVPADLAGHPRYEVQEQLGGGGMGEVYRARHRLMERPVALKVIRPGLLDSPAAIERFHQEVKAAARLSHPNIVTAFDAEQAGDTHFLVMEYVEGQSLAGYLKTQGPLPPAEACDYVRQAALGLQHAHQAGMVHRDIKPANLMRTPSGRVKVLDFGLARLASEPEPGSADGTVPEAADRLTQLGAVMGTADYMAPEQARDSAAADVRSDIYSLGCTLYELLGGRVPFPGGSFKDKLCRHAVEQPFPVEALHKRLPPGLGDVVRRMMAKNPRQRYQTPAEVAGALAVYSAAPKLKVERQRERREWRKRLVSIVSGLLICLAAVLTAALGLHFWTGKGELTISPDSPDAQVVITREGIVAAILDTRERKSLQLPPGQYVLTLRGEGLRVTPGRVSLQRGETVVARIEWTARGRLALGSANLQAEVVVTRGGKEVAILDTRNRTNVLLAPGEYDLTPKGEGLQVRPARVSLRPSETFTATVERTAPLAR